MYPVLKDNAHNKLSRYV